MKWIHIIAGLLALAAGAGAYLAAKGSPRHRLCGRVFVASMWVMTASAVLMAAFLRPNMVNVTAGLLTFHLVTTAWLAVRPPLVQARAVLFAMMLWALAVGLLAFSLGFAARASATGSIDQVPAPPLFMFGVVGLLAAALDARLLLAGGISGGHRLARHLWRMGFAMFVATASFFLGQAKFFPDMLRKPLLLSLPVLLVLGLLAYWLARVLWRARTQARASTTSLAKGVNASMPIR